MSQDHPVDEDVEMFDEEPAAKPRSKRLLWFLGAGAVLVVLLVGAAYQWVTTKDDATNAVVGDCLTALAGTDSIDIRNTKVDCTDQAAAYRVLGIVENVMLAEADCGRWPASNMPIWIPDSTDRRASGKVVCLQAISK
ncbi:hypothetical protein GCM10009682_15250 [Luedemannella flava]|uniref:Uncharacterized protein n=1 Tax=Luedemannella flava TaxID=349316 RepID=A0ABP4XTX0_9ACTN